MFTKSGNYKSRLSRQGGLSLVELVVFIVIVSVSIVGIFSVLNLATRTSADPVARKQALAIAESLLEEIELMPFTFCDPDDAGAAAPVFSAASEGNTGSTAVGSLTVSHTVGAAGTNRILVVGVNIFSDSAPLPTVSTMTYAGQSMTLLAAQEDGVAPSKIRTEMWYIKAPATGTNNIAITFSASVRAVAGGMSYTNVHQTTPFGTPATAGGLSDAPSVTVSSAAGELVVDTVGRRQNPAGTQTLTAGGGQTERYNDKSGTNDDNNVLGAGSEEAGAASVTMSWTANSPWKWAIVAAPLKPTSDCTTVEVIGPEAGESRYFTPQFDHVNDYHGFTMNSGNGGIKDITNTVFPALNLYSASVSVVQEALGSIAATESLRVTVTVTGPGNTTVTLDGYRTRYAPDATQ